MNDDILKKFEEKLLKTAVKAPRGITQKILSRIEETETPQGRQQIVWFPRFILKPSLAVLYTAVILSAGWLLHKNMQEERVNVAFVLYHPNAARVAVAGDFNKWDTDDGIIMEEENGYWSATVALQPGLYQYMFVIDGEKWIPDPSNTSSAESAFGGINSVIEVKSS